MTSSRDDSSAGVLGIALVVLVALGMLGVARVAVVGENESLDRLRHVALAVPLAGVLAGAVALAKRLSGRPWVGPHLVLLWVPFVVVLGVAAFQLVAAVNVVFDRSPARTIRAIKVGEDRRTKGPSRVIVDDWEFGERGLAECGEAFGRANGTALDVDVRAGSLGIRWLSGCRPVSP